jgi:hypothetical protein
MRTREQLLDSLASELTPVVRPPAPGLLYSTWLVASAAYVVLLTWLLGPIRPVALQQLLTVPRFSLEMLVGTVAACALAALAFRSAVPGSLSRGFAWGALGVLLLWLANFVLGIAIPTLEPSMLGKRDHCYLETFLYALPPLVGALYWQQRLYPMSPRRAAMLAGLAAGMLPALYMQIACMYESVHILAFHVGPALLVAAVAPLMLLTWQKALAIGD